MSDSVKQSGSGLNLDGREKAMLESQHSKLEEQPVTYHADFEMPVFNIQVGVGHVFLWLLFFLDCSRVQEKNVQV